MWGRVFEESPHIVLARFVSHDLFRNRFSHAIKHCGGDPVIVGIPVICVLFRLSENKLLSMGSNVALKGHRPKEIIGTVEFYVRY